MTAPEKGRWCWFKNWLHYHWLYLVIVAVVFWVGISWLANALHWGETLPDYQIAYVGKSSLPDDTARAIEAVFARYGEDLNGDGKVCVKLHQYVSDTEDKENASTYALAAQMQFLSDMNAEDSYFLLLDDPAHFQLDYQALANWDGTPPDDNDYTAAGKTVRWTDCPVLAGADLGIYQTTVLVTTVTGKNAELVETLYLGRRTFYEDAKTEKAVSAVSGWKELAEQNYQITDTQTLTAAGQEYTVILFAYQSDSNPYAKRCCRLCAAWYKCDRMGTFRSGYLFRGSAGCSDGLFEWMHLLRKEEHGHGSVFSE